MSRVPLLGGAYRDRSPIASAQETINLYMEKNTNAQAPSQTTYYQTPGTTLFGEPDQPNKSRCCYRTTLGTAYEVVGTRVYAVAINGAMVFVGAIPDRASQVIMSDNGLIVILVDGVQGWAINLADNSFTEIIDPAFYGADYVLFLNTFFVFNRPKTNQFYISLSMINYAQIVAMTAFDPLDIAAKSGAADPILAIATVHAELWLIGVLTTEIWIGTGAADFFFQQVQGSFIDHGCGAQFSVACTDVVVFWLMQDRQGQFQIMKGAGYTVENIATSYLTDQMEQMETVADVVAGIFQQENHAFYVMNFITANITFAYDLTTNEWIRWSWLDENGNINRHRAQCFMFFDNQNIIGDWETGKLYILDPEVYTDFGGPILRRKTFLHMVGQDYERVIYNSFDADIEVATNAIDDPNLEPMMTLSWSDDRGRTYGNGVQQGFGLQGQYLTTMSWNRLGMARDRVFKLEWSAAIKTSLLGGFADVKASRT